MDVKSLRIVACAAVLGVAACGESATDVLGDLTQAEAAALAEVVGATLLTSAVEVPTEDPEGGPAAAPFSGSGSIDAEAPCALGGTVSVSGTLSYEGDDETGEVEADLAVTQVHHGCVAESQDGTRFTLTGAPQIAATLSLLVSENTLSMTGSYAGAVGWETDGREGTCSIDIEFSIDMSGESGAASMSGSVCGADVSHSLNVG
jgi:hypothetical protein